ncbi:MAG: helix-turn-helix transcriptional regulator [Spirosomaceae bacterium]|nr:helix-turn-helix transcriptional regulator [Spirosomataceae bacterium]
MNETNELSRITGCSNRLVLAVNDTLNVISGKWKFPIIASLLHGKKRFKELQDNISRITPRMLSKELKELELNGIISRTVYDTTPVLIEYELTPSGESLKEVIEQMVKWGLMHRNISFSEEQTAP